MFRKKLHIDFDILVPMLNIGTLERKLFYLFIRLHVYSFDYLLIYFFDIFIHFSYVFMYLFFRNIKLHWITR